MDSPPYRQQDHKRQSDSQFAELMKTETRSLPFSESPSFVRFLVVLILSVMLAWERAADAADHVPPTVEKEGHQGLTSVWLYAPFVDPQTRSVKVSRLNLRKGPGDNYEIVGHLFRGTQVRELSVLGDWMEIETPASVDSNGAEQPKPEDGGKWKSGEQQWARDAVPAPSMPPAPVTGSATAFFITEDGFALTSFHVVDNASRLSLRTRTTAYPAQVIRLDKANDLALIKATGKFSFLPLQVSRGIQLGESVFTIGFPNIVVQGLEPKFTDGKISGLAGPFDDPRFFQISVDVQPGNSGGPLVNSHGNVVGWLRLG
jgi:S1-C subfamily serine protease